MVRRKALEGETHPLILRLAELPRDEGVIFRKIGLHESEVSRVLEWTGERGYDWKFVRRVELPTTEIYRAFTEKYDYSGIPPSCHPSSSALASLQTVEFLHPVTRSDHPWPTNETMKKKTDQVTYSKGELTWEEIARRGFGVGVAHGRGIITNYREGLRIIPVDNKRLVSLYIDNNHWNDLKLSPKYCVKVLGAAARMANHARRNVPILSDLEGSTKLMDRVEAIEAEQEELIKFLREIE